MKIRDIGLALIGFAAFALFFYLGVAHEFYAASFVRDNVLMTIVLRKAYSLVAFAALGFLADVAAARPQRPLRVREGALLVGGASALIEIGQDLHGSTEGIVWNVGDILFGMFGGGLGVALSRLLRTGKAG